MVNKTTPLRAIAVKLHLAAFTLIEMLVVIAVIGLITAAVTPMVFSTLIATKLSSAGQTMASGMSLAHGLAVAGSHEVEVRFYSYVDNDEPGSKEAYRAIVMVNPPANTTDNGVQLGEILRLPSGIIIGESSAMSPLLMSDAVTGSTDKERFIRSATARYKAFRFRPDGTTTIMGVAPNQCYFSLGEERLLSDAGRVPPNFFAIQIDPLTGRATSYRP